eukprot:3224833-Prymnesium_polylepis.1
MTSEAPPKPAGIVPGDEAGAKRGKAGESPRSAKKAKKAEQQTPVEKARAQYHQAVADAAAEGKEPWMLLDGLSGHKASTAGAKGVHFKEELHRVRTPRPPCATVRYARPARLCCALRPNARARVPAAAGAQGAQGLLCRVDGGGRRQIRQASKEVRSDCGGARRAARSGARICELSE